MSESDGWRSAWGQVTVSWDDASICFVCPCGNEIIFSESDERTCGCGRQYRYSVQLLVKPTDAQPT